MGKEDAGALSFIRLRHLSLCITAGLEAALRAEHRRVKAFRRNRDNSAFSQAREARP